MCKYLDRRERERENGDVAVVTAIFRLVWQDFCFDRDWWEDINTGEAYYYASVRTLSRNGFMYRTIRSPSTVSYILQYKSMKCKTKPHQYTNEDRASKNEVKNLCHLGFQYCACMLFYGFLQKKSNNSLITQKRFLEI